VKLDRIVWFEPSYDKRSKDPARDYGISDVKVMFILKGEEGAVHFLFSTGWFLPHLREELEEKGHFFRVKYPWAMDLGYHSPKPIHGDETHFDDCDVLGGECYYDGSGLNAIPLLEKLVAEGDEAVWKELEKYYEETFGEKEGGG